MLLVDSALSWPSYKTQTSSLAFLSCPLFSRRRRLNSGELFPSPQRKIALEKPCPSSACSLRIRPSSCYGLISPRARCPCSSSSRPATSTKTLIHRGQHRPVSCCPFLLTLRFRLDVVVLIPLLPAHFAHCSRRNAVVDEVRSAVITVTVETRHHSFSGLARCFNTSRVSP